MCMYVYLLYVCMHVRMYMYVRLYACAIVRTYMYVIFMAITSC